MSPGGEQGMCTDRWVCVHTCMRAPAWAIHWGLPVALAALWPPAWVVRTAVASWTPVRNERDREPWVGRAWNSELVWRAQSEQGPCSQGKAGSPPRWVCGLSCAGFPPHPCPPFPDRENLFASVQRQCPEAPEASGHLPGACKHRAATGAEARLLQLQR